MAVRQSNTCAGQVSAMLAKDPRHRPSAAEAFAAAQMALAALGDKPSGLSLMLDIVDMCKLLDYEAGVCRAEGLHPLPRTFFDIPDEKGAPNAKFYYFRSLVLWLLGRNGVAVEERGDSIFVDGKVLRISYASSAPAHVQTRTKAPALARVHVWVSECECVDRHNEMYKYAARTQMCCDKGRETSGANNGAEATVLLEACKGLALAVDSDVMSPMRVKAGWGEPVCLLLHALLKHTMDAQGMRLVAPRHAGDEGEGEVVEEVAGIGEEDAMGAWMPEHDDDDGADDSDGEADLSPGQRRGLVGKGEERKRAGGGEAGMSVWVPCRETDLEELRERDVDGQGWRGSMERLEGAWRRHRDGGRAVFEELGRVSERARQEVEAIAAREHSLNQVVSTAANHSGCLSTVEVRALDLLVRMRACGVFKVVWSGHAQAVTQTCLPRCVVSMPLLRAYRLSWYAHDTP